MKLPAFTYRLSMSTVIRIVEGRTAIGGAKHRLSEHRARDPRYPKGPIIKWSNLECGWYSWISLLRALKLDHLQAIEPSVSWKFSNFLTFILGSHFLLPKSWRGPIMGKGNSHQPRKEWDSGFSVLGTFKLHHLHPFRPILLKQIFNFFTFILESHFLLPQRANYGKVKFIQLKKWMR